MKEKVKGYFRKLIEILKKPEMAILPANIAFYIILAIIPLFTIVALIISSFDISIDLITDMVKEIIPGDASDIIVGVISGKGFDGNIGFFNIVAVIVASNGTYAMINTSDAIYKIKETDWLKKRISSLFLLFIIIVLFVFMLIVPVFGENILNLMRKADLLAIYADEIIALFNILKWPITLFIIYFNIKLVYAIAPSKNIRSSETTYGAMFTTVCWIVATVIFRFYLTYFARYDIIYGNLSSLIILMVWVYFLSYIFVLGMGINASKYEKEVKNATSLKIEGSIEDKTIKEDKFLDKDENKSEEVKEKLDKPKKVNNKKKKAVKEKTKNVDVQNND